MSTMQPEEPDEIDAIIDAEMERRKEAKFDRELAAAVSTVAAAFDPINRCDRCGAEAKVRVTKGENELLFCGHHAQDFAQALLDAGWEGEQIQAPETVASVTAS